MDKIVKTEETIQDEEAIMRHIPIKNEPGTSVDRGAEEVTVKLENKHNLITSFWSLTKDTTFKTKHPLLNQNLTKVKDEITVKTEWEQNDNFSKFPHYIKCEDTNSLDDSEGCTPTVWLVDNDADVDNMMKAELEHQKDTIKTESGHGIDEESKRMITDVPTALPREEAPETSFVCQANMIKTERKQPGDSIKVESDDSMKNQEGELMISNVQIFLPREGTAVSTLVHEQQRAGESGRCRKISRRSEHEDPTKSKNHKSTCSGFKCKCEKWFSCVSRLKKHLQVHTCGKQYKCQVCGKSFTQISNLKAHNRIHMGEKPFECKVCEKSFTSKGNLKIHTQIHTGEKPFECQVCGKAFRRNNMLTEHSRIHTGEKPFECKVCGKSFIQNGNLAAHSRIHTGEKPF